ncbi:hypothetical protein GZL_02975 [Streptomyces sp. 769]|nr:hypothetical protein GZL_02975 [Streptomyces sp. 769]
MAHPSRGRHLRSAIRYPPGTPRGRTVSIRSPPRPPARSR